MYRIRLVSDLIPGIQLRIPPIHTNETIIYATLAALLFVMIGIIKNMYDLYKPAYNYFSVFTKVRGIWLVTITFIAYFGQGFVFVGGISRLIILFSAAITFVVLRIIDHLLQLREYTSIHKDGQKILLIAPSVEAAYPVLEKISSHIPHRYDICTIQEVWSHKLETYAMLFLIGNYPSDEIQEIFEKIRLSTTRFFHINEGFFLEDVVYESENIWSLIGREYKHSQLDGWAIVGKRIFDIVWSVVWIIILSPILLITAIAVKIDSRWPVFYIQKRVGHWWKLISFIKFRSMFAHMSVGEKYGGKDAQAIYDKLIASDQNTRDGVLPKITNDPRVTKIGAFIRKTSIDELPQLFSVLRWTMSLVWPRPHLPSEVAQYESRQKRLLSIKPGITGYAQVFGRDSLDFTQEAKLDLYYIEHWSIFMDVYVLFATVRVLGKGR